MKHLDTFKLVMLMFTFSVCLAIILAVVGIVFKGAATTPEQVQVRMVLVDLLKIITGGVLGAVATIKSNKSD